MCACRCCCCWWLVCCSCCDCWRWWCCSCCICVWCRAITCPSLLLLLPPLPTPSWSPPSSAPASTTEGRWYEIGAARSSWTMLIKASLSTNSGDRPLSVKNRSTAMSTELKGFTISVLWLSVSAARYNTCQQLYTKDIKTIIMIAILTCI